jgi:hypothetical protein
VGAVLGAILLMLGALLGLMTFVVETCTGNAPDSLMLGPFVLGLNLLGFAALGWSSRPLVTGAVALLPGMAAFGYSLNTALLASGTPACELITGHGGWERTPDHRELVMLWVATSLSFWLGLAAAMWRGCRRSEKDILT